MNKPNRVLTVILAVALLLAALPQFASAATPIFGWVQVRSATAITTASFTRPNDSTPYTAKDVVSNSTSATTLMTFAAACQDNGSGGYVTKVNVFTDQSTNTARFRLWLFKVVNPTVAVDNAGFVPTWADRANYVGYVDLVGMATETGSSMALAMNSTTRLGYQCAAADTALYGFLETLDAFTPAAQQNFQVNLLVEPS